MGKDTHAVTREGPGCTRETPGEEVITRVLQLECREKTNPSTGSGKITYFLWGKTLTRSREMGPAALG